MFELLLKQLGLNPDTVKSQIADGGKMLKEFSASIAMIQKQQAEITRGINILLKDAGHEEIATPDYPNNNLLNSN